MRRGNAIAAFLIVALLVASLALSGLVSKGSSEKGKLLSTLVHEDETFQSYTGSSELERFETECFSLAEFEDLRSAQDGMVIGFCTDGSADEVFEALSQCLQDKAWRAIASGNPRAGSFTKDTGELVWVFMTCTQVGQSTSVVVQCASTAEGKA